MALIGRVALLALARPVPVRLLPAGTRWLPKRRGRCSWLGCFLMARLCSTTDSLWHASEWQPIVFAGEGDRYEATANAAGARAGLDSCALESPYPQVGERVRVIRTLNGRRLQMSNENENLVGTHLAIGRTDIPRSGACGVFLKPVKARVPHSGTTMMRIAWFMLPYLWRNRDRTETIRS